MSVLTYKNVLLRISDLTDLVDVSAHRERLKRIIYRAAIDSRPAVAMLTKSMYPLQVINGLAEKPCDLIRLLRVHAPSSINDTGPRLGEAMEPTRLTKYGYDHDSAYIKPSGIRSGTIYIDYYAVPLVTVTDESGQECQELMIGQEQLDYCAYEGIRIILRDELARGKMNANVYMLFEEEAQNAFQSALSNTRQITIDQMEATAWMMRNAQFFNLK